MSKGFVITKLKKALGLLKGGAFAQLNSITKH
jgi:hypothetical protein